MGDIQVSNRRRAVALSLAAVVASSALAACSTGSDGTPSPDNTSSAASGGTAATTSSFYKGKTITFIVPGAPGKGSANFATAVQHAMGNALGATINIQYVTGADVVGQDRVWNAKADGLTIGALTVISDINNTFSKNEALTFKLTDAAATSIGASYASPGIFVACGHSSIKTFNGAITGGTQLKWVDVTTGGMNLAAHLLMDAYPTNHKFLNGYTSSTETVACERGDGNVAGYPVGNFLDSSGTKLIPGLTGLLLTDSMPSTSPAVALNDTVPTLAKFAESHPPATDAAKAALTLLQTYFSIKAPQFAIFGPKGIPADRSAELAAAMKTAMADPAVQKQLANAGIAPGYVDPAGVQTYIDKMVQSQDVATKALSN